MNNCGISSLSSPLEITETEAPFFNFFSVAAAYCRSAPQNPFFLVPFNLIVSRYILPIPPACFMWRGFGIYLKELFFCEIERQINSNKCKPATRKQTNFKVFATVSETWVSVHSLS